MNNAKRRRLENLIWERLKLLRDDEYWYESDSYSFLSSEGFIGYCSFSNPEFESFDRVDRDLNLPWSQKRKDAIYCGDAEPNEKELRQWRKAMARFWVDIKQFEYAAFIVPVAGINEAIAEKGFALFLGNLGDAPEDAPSLVELFESVEDAESYLRRKGAVSEGE